MLSTPAVELLFRLERYLKTSHEVKYGMSQKDELGGSLDLQKEEVAWFVFKRSFWDSVSDKPFVEANAELKEHAVILELIICLDLDFLPVMQLIASHKLEEVLLLLL